MVVHHNVYVTRNEARLMCRLQMLEEKELQKEVTERCILTLKPWRIIPYHQYCSPASHQPPTPTPTAASGDANPRECLSGTAQKSQIP